MISQSSKILVLGIVLGMIVGGGVTYGALNYSPEASSNRRPVTRPSGSPSPTPPTTCKEGDNTKWRDSIRDDINAKLQKTLDDDFKSAYSKATSDYKIDGSEQRTLLLKALALNTLTDKEFQDKAAQLAPEIHSSFYADLAAAWDSKVPGINVKFGSLAQQAALKYLSTRVSSSFYNVEDKNDLLTTKFNYPGLEVETTLNLSRLSKDFRGGVTCKLGALTGSARFEANFSYTIRQVAGGKLTFSTKTSQQGGFGAGLKWNKTF